ncbi:Cadherin-8 [Acipenser ruthenus]|uniref:Cadherin-8 n=1 Tax=Acipenser ruthenus TaxID=7906 RepID=A0A444UKX9_ACIRT|nr:Cadherin-8 [Acipenser ruthenus]
MLLRSKNLYYNVSGLYHFSIPEDITLSDAVGRVKANDRDIGENARSAYDIIDGDGIDVFEITTDPQTQEGILRLKKDCTTPRYLAAGSSNAVKLSRFFDKKTIECWNKKQNSLTSLAKAMKR